MSWRQSKKQMRSYVPGYSCAVATANSVRSETPASFARDVAMSIDARRKSNPWTVEFGYALAMTTTDAT